MEQPKSLSASEVVGKAVWVIGRCVVKNWIILQKRIIRLDIFYFFINEK